MSAGLVMIPSFIQRAVSFSIYIRQRSPISPVADQCRLLTEQRIDGRVHFLLLVLLLARVLSIEIERGLAFASQPLGLDDAGEDRRRIEPFPERLAHLFSPDGARLASAGSDGTVRLWDAVRGEPVAWRAELLPGGEHAVLRADGSGAIAVSPGAWRWLGWLAKDLATGALTRYPAETFGDLPPASQNVRSTADGSTLAARRAGRSRPEKVIA